MERETPATPATLGWTKAEYGFVRCNMCDALVSKHLPAMLAHVDAKHADSAPARENKATGPDAPRKVTQ